MKLSAFHLFVSRLTEMILLPLTPQFALVVCEESGRLNVFPAKRFTDSVMHFDRLQGLARISARCFISVRPAARVVFFRRSVT